MLVSDDPASEHGQKLVVPGTRIAAHFVREKVRYCPSIFEIGFHCRSDYDGTLHFQQESDD